MSRPDGAHTHGHGHGGGGLGLVLIIVLAVIVAKVGHAIGQAADTAGHVLTVVFEVVFISVAVLAAVAVAAALTWAGVRVHRWHRARAVRVARAVAAARADIGVILARTLDDDAGLAEVTSSGLQAIESGRGRCPLCGEKTSDGKCKCPGFSADPVLVPTAKGS